MEFKNIQVQLSTNAGAFAAQMGQAGAAVNTFGSQLQRAEASFARAGQTMMGAGKTLTAAVTLPIAAIGVGAIKAASDFESSFAGVRKTVDATEKEFAELEAGFRSLSKTIPVNVNELNAIGEAAGQLGIEKENILAFTDTIAKMGVATNLSTDEAANAFARLSNVMGTSQQDFDKLGNVVVDLGNNAAATESEIVEFGLRIAGAGKIAGLTEGDILGIGAAFASVNVGAEAGGTAVQKVILSITEQVATGGEKLALFAKTAGMSANEFADSWRSNPGQAFTAFVEGLGNAGTDAIGILDELDLKDQRLIRSFLAVAAAGDLVETSITRGNEAMTNTAAITKEVGNRFATFDSQWQLLKNSINDVFISLGQALLPTLRSFVQFLTNTAVPGLEKMVQIFTSLPESMQAGILVFAGMAAAIGPLLIAFGLIASGISSLLPLFASLKTASLVFGPMATNARLAGPAILAMAQSLRTAAGAAKALGIALKASAVLFAADFIVGGAFRAEAALKDLRSEAKNVGMEFKDLPNAVELVTAEIQLQEQAIENVKDRYRGLGKIRILNPFDDFGVGEINEHEGAIEGLEAALKDLKGLGVHASMIELVEAHKAGTEAAGEQASASEILEGASQRAGQAQRIYAGEVQAAAAKEKNALDDSITNHDSWMTSIEDRLESSASSHDSWVSSLDKSLTTSGRNYGDWVGKVTTHLQDVSAATQDLTTTLEEERAKRFQGLQLEGEALEEFSEGFTEAYQSATNVLQQFAGDSEVTHQKILDQYVKQLEAVRNWQTNLATLADEIGKSGPGKALLKDVALMGPEQGAAIAEALVQAAKEGTIGAILEARTGIDDVMNEIQIDLNGREFTPVIDLDVGPFEGKLPRITAALDELTDTTANPKIDPVTGPFEGKLDRVMKDLQNLTAQTAVPKFDPDYNPFQSKLDRALSSIGLLTGQTAVPTFDPNTGPFESDLDRALSSIGLLTGQTALPTFDSHDGPLHSKAHGAHVALNDLGARAVYPTVGVNDQASGKLAAIKRALDSIPAQKTTKIVVEQSRHQGGEIYHGGGIVTMHDGGLRPDERIAKLQTGEFVLQRSAVQSLGSGILREMNATGQIPWNRFVDAMGGVQGTRQQVSGLRDDLSGTAASKGTTTVVIQNLNVRAVPDMRSRDMGVDRFVTELKQRIKSKVEASL